MNEVKDWLVAETGYFLGRIVAKLPAAIFGSLLFAVPLMWLLNRFLTDIGYWDSTLALWCSYWTIHGLRGNHGSPRRNSPGLQLDDFAE